MGLYMWFGFGFKVQGLGDSSLKVLGVRFVFQDNSEDRCRARK